MTKTAGIPASALIRHSGIVLPRYCVGDQVEVLDGVTGRSVVTGVSGEYPDQLYEIEGFMEPRHARHLRLIIRGGR